MKKRIKKVISIISILMVCLFGYYFLNKYFKIAIPCIFNKFTGYLCPGCGITRCLFSLIEGNFIGAFWYNSWVTILLGPFSIYVVVNIIRYIKDGDYVKIPAIVVTIILVITILFGIVRNII